MADASALCVKLKQKHDAGDLGAEPEGIKDGRGTLQWL